MTYQNNPLLKKNSQRGQALVEFVVFSVALLPLLLLIPMIAKYQDISSTTQAASRYVAFEAMNRNADTVNGWKDEASLANEVRRRFYSNNDAPIKSGDVAGDFKAQQNLFWRDPTDRALIEQINRDVTVTYGNGNGTTHQAGFIANSSANDGAFAGFNNNMNLSNTGVYQANVAVKLLNVPADLALHKPFDTLNLSIRRSTSLALNPWTATDHGQVNQRVGNSGAVFPVGQVQGLTALLDPLVAAAELPGRILGGSGGKTSGPMIGRLDFWTDVVPADRLRP
jgi:hypothetical protein